MYVLIEAMKYQPGWGKTRLKFVCLLGMLVLAVAANQPTPPREWRTPPAERTEKKRPHEADFIGAFFTTLLMSPVYIVGGAVFLTCAGLFAVRRR